jgi:uncharacterized protein
MAEDRQHTAQQDEVIAPVERIETHAALVFLSGDRAIKIKKPVALGYLDFSTVEQRRRALARELELNRPNAPEIYLDLVPVGAPSSGGLSLGGEGEPVEWALFMRRFDQDQLLDRIAARRPLDADLANALADAVLAAHRKAPVARRRSGRGHGPACRPDLRRPGAPWSLASRRRRSGRAPARRWSAPAAAWRRAAAGGFVRRCHGDLHLGNIVVIDGRPVLFDALEFDERWPPSTCSTTSRSCSWTWSSAASAPAANRVLNRYLQGAPGNEEGLAALPLFLGLRAGVRAMVIAERPPIGRATIRGGGISRAGA